MKRSEIEHIIAMIMINDGPDGHCDGNEIIADFVIAVKDGCPEKWFQDYKTRKEDEAEGSMFKTEFY